MKATVTEKQFIDAFDFYGRSRNFSNEGRIALFEYLEDYEEFTGEEIELDVIGLCCDYKEFLDIEDLQRNHPKIEDMDELRDHTTVIEIEGTDRFIIKEF